MHCALMSTTRVLSFVLIIIMLEDTANEGFSERLVLSDEATFHTSGKDNLLTLRTN